MAGVHGKVWLGPARPRGLAWQTRPVLLGTLAQSFCFVKTGTLMDLTIAVAARRLCRMRFFVEMAAPRFDKPFDAEKSCHDRCCVCFCIRK